MTGFRYRWILLLLLLSLAGCSNLPLLSGIGNTTPETAIPSAAPATQPAQGTSVFGTREATPVTSQPASENTLRIWLPPEFDPGKDGAASQLLKNRLVEFETEHPELRLDVRIKDLNGPGGMLESLAAANVSAPGALPSLVLLPQPLLESAALKGLLTPFNSLSSKMDEPGWFSYAQELAHVETEVFGLPFAGDALVMAYKPSLTGVVPHSLDELTSLGGVLLFPAGDTQALFTLALYVNVSRSLQDEQGRPSLDKDLLTRVLQFERDASLAGTMPTWLTQYLSDAQAWDAFTRDQFPMVVTWASTYLKDRPNQSADMALTSLPTWDGTPFTLATGWSWALAAQDAEGRALGAKLAEYLVDSQFMGAWALAAGYLPPREDVLQTWEDGELRNTLQQISSSAQLMPASDLVSSVGPRLAQAVVKVLRAENDPETAAQSLINHINQP